MPKEEGLVKLSETLALAARFRKMRERTGLTRHGLASIMVDRDIMSSLNTYYTIEAARGWPRVTTLLMMVDIFAELLPGEKRNDIVLELLGLDGEEKTLGWNR